MEENIKLDDWAGSAVIYKNEIPFVKFEDERNMICDICGKNYNIVAMDWVVYDSSGGSGEGLNFAEQIKPYKLDKHYKICYPCFFKKLGVKP